MSTLAIEFRTKPDHVYAQIPRNRRGTVYSGVATFTPYPRTGSEQCPGCGGDIVEHWRMSAENPDVAEPELGDAFAAHCTNQSRDPDSGVESPECGYRMTGTVIDMNEPDPRG